MATTHLHSRTSDWIDPAMRQGWYGVSHIVLRRTDSAAHCDGRRVPGDPAAVVVCSSCLEVGEVAETAECAVQTPK